MGQDKIMHIMVNFGATVAIGLVLTQIFGLPITTSCFIIIILGFGAGIGKELYDRKKTGFSTDDFKAGVMGIALGLFVIALIKAYKGEESWTWFCMAIMTLILGMMTIIALGWILPFLLPIIGGHWG